VVDGLYGGFWETCRHMANAASPTIEKVMNPKIAPSTMETRVLLDIPVGA
jgi:hypothetical protein